MSQRGFGDCPLPFSQYDRIVLGHGSGGTLSTALVRDLFLRELDDPVLAALEDQAVLPAPPSGFRLALTTDAFVVTPPEFPGGDIGALAVAGTVNDLCVGGATPRYLSAAFVLEEGTELSLIARIVRTMARTAREANVAIVAGDTKVVERGKGDGIFITTTGVGFVPLERDLSAHGARPGDALICSGTLGDHGIAVMSVREGLSFETTLESDVAPLGSLVARMLDACPSIRCMRDPTRGGLASALCEIAEASSVGFVIEEAAIPLKPQVRVACELLGLDPLYVASEGRLLAVAPATAAPALLDAMRSHPLGADARVIGVATAEHAGRVMLRCASTGRRWVTRLAGEQLPRIC